MDCRHSLRQPASEEVRSPTSRLKAVDHLYDCLLMNILHDAPKSHLNWFVKRGGVV